VHCFLKPEPTLHRLRIQAKPWRWISWSSSASGHRRRLSGEARGKALAAIVVVSAARCGGSWTKLVLTAFDAAIDLSSVIAAAVVVAANAATAALRRWLVVVSPTPLSVARFVIHHFCHCADVNTFAAAGCRPLSPTFASGCPIHHLRRSHRWLVAAFSARPAAYQLNH
jgi:hypothetical protein